MKDLELIDRIRQGDREAFDILFRKYYRSLTVYLESLSQDTYLSEDVVQEVFVDIWIDRTTLTVRKSVKGYLFWVCYTAYIDHYRKTKHRAHLLADIKEKAFRDALPDNNEVMELKVEKLKRIIETLPPVCKNVLELNKKYGLKYDEIAVKLNISKKTVESHMRAAFKKIREGFEAGTLLFILLHKMYCGDSTKLLKYRFVSHVTE